MNRLWFKLPSGLKRLMCMYSTGCGVAIQDKVVDVYLQVVAILAIQDEEVHVHVQVVVILTIQGQEVYEHIQVLVSLAIQFNRLMYMYSS